MTTTWLISRKGFPVLFFYEKDLIMKTSTLFCILSCLSHILHELFCIISYLVLWDKDKDIGSNCVVEMLILCIWRHSHFTSCGSGCFVFPNPKSTLDIFMKFDIYYLRYKSGLKPKDWMLEEFKRCREHIKKQVPVVFCHNDYHAKNMVFDPEKGIVQTVLINVIIQQ